MPSYSKTIKAADYNEFRDAVAGSGVFDMLDCQVEIWCPLESDVQEVQKMVTLLESMVHVTDVAISSHVQETAELDHYRVVVTETSSETPKKRFSRDR